MKLASSLFLTLASCLSLAQASTNQCTKSLIGVNDWSDLSETVLTCLDSNSRFTESIEFLCQTDRTQLSAQYQAFLKFKKQYEETLAWYQSLSPREQQSSSAKYKLRLARENWESRGLKYTVISAKNRLAESYRACSPVRE